MRALTEQALRRLPRYLHLLRAVRGLRESVSSTFLGEALDLDPVQIRKDLEATGIVGRPRTGYPVPALVEAIEAALGWSSPRRAVLVGTGNLGSALLGYPRFAASGLEIVAAFDADPGKVGREIYGRQVLPLERLDAVARRQRVAVGIVTVPAEVAQRVADALVAAGIVGIWNFAPVALRVPPGVVVQNEDLYTGLAALSSKLAVAGHPAAPPSPRPRRGGGR